MSKVEIKAVENGPNVVFVDGKPFTAMCRCGDSNNKPYCDGAHAKIGFYAGPTELRALNERTGWRIARNHQHHFLKDGEEN